MWDARALPDENIWPILFREPLTAAVIHRIYGMVQDW